MCKSKVFYPIPTSESDLVTSCYISQDKLPLDGPLPIGLYAHFTYLPKILLVSNCKASTPEWNNRHYESKEPNVQEQDKRFPGQLELNPDE